MNSQNHWTRIMKKILNILVVLFVLTQCNHPTQDQSTTMICPSFQNTVERLNLHNKVKHLISTVYYMDNESDTILKQKDRLIYSDEFWFTPSGQYDSIHYWGGGNHKYIYDENGNLLKCFIYDSVGAKRESIEYFDFNECGWPTKTVSVFKTGDTTYMNSIYHYEPSSRLLTVATTNLPDIGNTYTNYYQLDLENRIIRTYSSLNPLGGFFLKYNPEGLIEEELAVDTNSDTISRKRYSYFGKNEFVCTTYSEDQIVIDSIANTIIDANNNWTTQHVRRTSFYKGNIYINLSTTIRMIDYY